MKRALIFIAVFLLAISMISADDIILKLSSTTNAHAEVWNGTAYTTEILYRDIFGSNYTGDAYTCNGNNTVLKLSSATNAHAEDPALSNYGTEVCFGNMNCRLVETNDDPCPVGAGQQCVVKLSSATNAHLETCDNSNYAYSICCDIGQGPPGPTNCEDATNKIDCWAIGDRNCTWTPPGTHSNPEGGCCPDEEIWSASLGQCITSAVEVCNNVWMPTPEGQIQGVTWKKQGSNYQYCAQITSGLSYGYWYDINKF